MSDQSDCPAFPVSTLIGGHQDGERTWQFPGLTKREYFAAMAEGPDDDATPEWVADSLGIECPPPNARRREWFVWWRRAVALWKVAEADALIAALAEPQS